VTTPARPSPWPSAWAFAQRQIQCLLERYPDFFPTYTLHGRWKHEGEKWTDWCAGFLPGSLWLFFLQNSNPLWAEAARRYSQQLEPRKHDTSVHDLGFLFLPSYGYWYHVERKPELLEVLVVAAMTLRQRFQRRGGYLASFVGPHSLFIDVMMNVSLLFVGSRALGALGQVPNDAQARAWAGTDAAAAAEDLWQVGLKHCRTTHKYLVRPDGSTAQEGIFNPDTGQFVRNSTHQGVSENSCWSRGQAWALYGFACCYRLTREVEFLEAAMACADFFLSHLPEDRIPFWDFAVTDAREEPRDSSAAAVAASGLWTLSQALELRAQDPDAAPERTVLKRKAETYRNAAAQIAERLCSNDFLAAGDPEWEGIVKHAVYHYHKKLGVDESVIWGDYYFIESLYKFLTGNDVPMFGEPPVAPAA
jgi:unsaturated chondroitin disaccharide hydrolase